MYLAWLKPQPLGGTSAVHDAHTPPGTAWGWAADAETLGTDASHSLLKVSLLRFFKIQHVTSQICTAPSLEQSQYSSWTEAKL